MGVYLRAQTGSPGLRRGIELHLGLTMWKDCPFPLSFINSQPLNTWRTKYKEHYFFFNPHQGHFFVVTFLESKERGEWKIGVREKHD